MRHPATRFVLLFVMALFVAAVPSIVVPRVASADARADAKVHFQAGQKAYAGGDYRMAIKEFSAAQQLAPHDLNNYNLALCYDKLGEAEPAIQYYKEYLAKVPNAANRTEIEASVARLEGALQSAAAKREEARKAEDARKADEAKKAEEARKAAEAAKAAAATGGTAGTGTASGTGSGSGSGSGDLVVGASGSVGTSGTPGTGQIVSTGDAQLDRASQIDINAIREQRVGAGVADPRNPQGGNPQGVGNVNAGAAGGAGAGANPAQANANGPRNPTPDPNQPTDQPKKATPVYKKWWFWAVVVVSAFVVYQIATTDSNPNSQARSGLTGTTFSRPIPASPAPDMSGPTLLSW